MSKHEYETWRIIGAFAVVFAIIVAVVMVVL
jgi:hypothetical protein